MYISTSATKDGRLSCGKVALTLEWGHRCHGPVDQGWKNPSQGDSCGRIWKHTGSFHWTTERRKHWKDGCQVLNFLFPVPKWNTPFHNPNTKHPIRFKWFFIVTNRSDIISLDYFVHRHMQKLSPFSARNRRYVPIAFSLSANTYCCKEAIKVIWEEKMRAGNTRK